MKDPKITQARGLSPDIKVDGAAPDREISAPDVEHSLEALEKPVVAERPLPRASQQPHEGSAARPDGDGSQGPLHLPVPPRDSNRPGPKPPSPRALDDDKRLRGNATDYLLGTLEGWDAFMVLRFHGVEELSRPYHYTLDLARDPALGLLDLDAFVDTPATLAIASIRRRRLLHGIIAGAEMIGATETQLFYRVELVPHFARTRHRHGCRTFRCRSIVEVIAAVLENRVTGRANGVSPILPYDGEPGAAEELRFDSFVPASAWYRFVLVGDASGRLEDPEYMPSIVQYNESDFALVSRLLEAEGVTYYFEHMAGGVLMTITDAPAGVGLFGERQVAEHRAAGLGVGSDSAEFVRDFRPRRVLTSRAARIRDFDAEHPYRQPEGAAEAHAGAARGAEFMEFPAPGGALAGRSASLFAQIQLERMEAERAVSTGASNIRFLAPGARMLLTSPSGHRDDADLCITFVETLAVQHHFEGAGFDDQPFGARELPAAPSYVNHFRAVPAERRFRPARLTPRPSIHGIHRAIVTAEEVPAGSLEINTNADGDVRVRLAWDERPPEPGVPSSNWVPVTNPWAGTGYGAIHVPRVGQAVFVSFDHGDPDFPVVLGGFYSQQTPPPYDPSKQPRVFGIRSSSSPGGGGGYNEIQFDDSAGQELFNMRAQGDFNQDVQNDASTSIQGDRTTDLVGDDTVNVGGDKSVTVQGDLNKRAASVDIGATSGEAIFSASTNITVVAHGGVATLDGSDGAYVQGKVVVLTATAAASINCQECTIDAKDSIFLSCGGSSITLTPSAIKIQTSGDLTINGNTVTVTGRPIKMNC